MMRLPGTSTGMRRSGLKRSARGRAGGAAWLGACLLVLGFWPLPPLAEEASSRVIAVIDGDTVRIDPPVNAADEVRLAGIEGVKPPLGRPADRPWPLALQAERALAELAQGENVRLVPAERPVDRYGRLLAQAYLADGRWLQGELLREGLARVATGADSRAEAKRMQEIEAEAREARRGLWGSPVYAVASPTTVRDRVGSFAVVEGQVIAARRVKQRVYLNFGSDWRDDFTVTIAAPALPLFGQAGLDPLALAGQSVRVRGWVERYNGPVIEATHPEQIELLGPPAR
jgi:endonuclease YncB( thermonuclease family)